MFNPFSQPDFRITESYVSECLAGAAVPHTDYIAYTNAQFPGELFATVVEKKYFANPELGLRTCMLRMLVMITTDGLDLSDYEADGIAAFTRNFCLGNWYGRHHFTEYPAAYFRRETDFLFGSFEECLAGYGKNHPRESASGPHGYFINNEPVEKLETTNPLPDEQILRVYSLVDYPDGRFFFGIGERHYMLVNWQSGGPLHLLSDPQKRASGSMLLSRDVFNEALGLIPPEEDPGKQEGDNVIPG